MPMKQFLSLAMSAALLASPLVMAEETQPSDTGMATATEVGATEETPSAEKAPPAMPAGMATSQPDATEADEKPGGAMPMPMMGMGMKGGMPGDCTGRPGMMGGKGMMGGMPGGPMGQPGMMGSDGMMDMPGMGRKGRMMGGRGGPDVQQHYREVMGRLDLMDARLAKIEAMLEHLLQR